MKTAVTALARVLTALLCLLAASCRTPQPRPPGLAIIDVTVIDVRDGSLAPHMTVLVAGGRIGAVGPSRSVRMPQRARRIDGAGKFLIPGLWDMHVHSDGDPVVLYTMLAAGITGVRDMGGDTVSIAATRRQIDDRVIAGPRMFVAGPAEMSIEQFAFLPKPCLVLLSGERGPAGRRPRGCDRESLDALFRGFAAHQTWLVPAIQSFRFSAPAQWESIRSGFRELATQLREDRVSILAGTDWSPSLEKLGAPAGWMLHAELAALVDAGFTPGEALRAATVNAVRFQGLSESLGTIEAGKTADLLLLDANPLADIRNTRRVSAVVSNGTLAFVP